MTTLIAWLIALQVLPAGLPEGERHVVRAQQGPPQVPAEAAPAEPDRDGPGPPRFEQQVEVVAITPLPGSVVPKRHIPSHVQTTTAPLLAGIGTADVASGLAHAFASVHLNDVQHNPAQPDLMFRGFTGSPLLGSSQGIAVYQDGVRVNEPFGDTINWDLIPLGAIAGAELTPGSSALFGLNALGGALSLRTKSGSTHPGHRAAASLGSFGRRQASVESGGRRGTLDYFLTGQVLDEDGWRDFSPTLVRQTFGAASWRASESLVRVAVTGAANDLTGNGSAPEELLAIDRRAVFTHPDVTITRMALATLGLQHRWGDRLLFDGVAFHRRGRLETFNGDDTALEPCGALGLAGLLCEDDDDEEPARDRLGRGLPARIDGRPLDAMNNESLTRTRATGGGLQGTFRGSSRGSPQVLTAGANLDRAVTRFGFSSEVASLTPTRGTEGAGLFYADADVRLDATVDNRALFAAAVLVPSPSVAVTMAARLHDTDVRLRDRLGTALTGTHHFRRLNPFLGATWQAGERLGLFGGYSESSRVPTPVELTCADPDDPCRLPNAFVSDPPLAQAVGRTWEAGLRGTGAQPWTVALFSTRVEDDIVFVSSGTLRSEGHFENVGATRRRGIELTASASLGSRTNARLAYTGLRATFDSPFVAASPNHPLVEGGDVRVSRGDRIPAIPAHQAKLAVSSRVSGWLTLGGDVLYESSRYLRGDEANLDAPIDGFWLAHLRGRVHLARPLAVTWRVSNLFNAEYATFGVYGEADEVLGDDFDGARFVGPGAPRAGWVGVEVRF
jgi:iron complex outermembrane recepter protein